MKNWVYGTVSAMSIFGIALACGFLGIEGAQRLIATATLPVAATFIWLYSTDGWWKSWFGRSLMLLATSVLAYALAVVLYRSYGDYPGRTALLLVATGGTFLAMLLRTMVLWSIKRLETQERAA